MRPDQILDKAAAIIKRNGWHQGSFILSIEDDERPINDCEVCVVGAIRLAGGLSPIVPPDPDSAIKLACNALAEHLGAVSLPRWNDRVATSGKQVIAELRACAARLREQAAS